jgi:CubicO group peptidase (beta-lactamase class C family)
MAALLLLVTVCATVMSAQTATMTHPEKMSISTQMFLDEGKFEGKQLLKPETIRYFTTAPFTANKNRRALGFDKLPLGEKDPSTASKSASTKSYGHTGYTGTFFWADPENDLSIIFLSNRVCPSAEPNRLSRLNIRTLLHDILYQAYQ